MNTALMEGVSVMAIGMGTVLTFLCLTIFSMIIMSRVVRWLNTLFPEQLAVVVEKKTAAPADDAIALAIAAAISRK